MDGRLYYQPLRRKRQIRLLVLHPGEKGETVKCSLRLARLPGSDKGDGNSNVNNFKPAMGSDDEYDALSYVWGTAPPAAVKKKEEEEELAEITMNGWPTRVGQNLWHFLIQVRPRITESSKSRMLWIDALCINQADNMEKAGQVRIMGDIYQNARKVLVWLGATNDKSDVAMRFLSSLPRREFDLSRLSSSTMKEEKEEEEEVRSALNAWASRDYWTRIWTVQEFVLANQLEIMCGDMVIGWRALRHFHSVVSQSASLTHDDATDQLLKYCSSAAYSLVQQRFASSLARMPFLDLLWRNRSRQCYDARDKIYAMLALVTRDSSSLQNMDVDYDAHLRSVILDVLEYCRVPPSEIMLQGKFLYDLLQVEQWEALDPKRSLDNWRKSSQLAHSHRSQCFAITGYKMGEVIAILTVSNQRLLVNDVLDSVGEVLRDCYQDDIRRSMAALSTIEFEKLCLSEVVLSELNASLNDDSSTSTRLPHSELTDSKYRTYFVAFTSFLRKKGFLLCVGSGTVRKGDKLLGFAGSKHNLLFRELMLDSEKSFILGSAVCVPVQYKDAPSRGDTSLPDFKILSNTAECVDMRQNFTMYISGACVSALSGR